MAVEAFSHVDDSERGFDTNAVLLEGFTSKACTELIQTLLREAVFINSLLFHFINPSFFTGFHEAVLFPQISH